MPRVAAWRHIDGVEVLRGLHLALAAAEERDARQRGRHCAQQRAHGVHADVGRRARLLAVGARQHHVGLEQAALQQHVVVGERLEHGRQHALGHVGAHLNRVAAVHQDLGLHNGHQAVLPDGC